MAVRQIGEQALANVPSSDESLKTKVINKNVLDEDTYSEGLETIIQRDFFPDLSKLQAQSEFLDAWDKKDTEKLRQIQIKYGPKRNTRNTPSLYSTPATFETPELQIHQTPKADTQHASRSDTETPLTSARTDAEQTHNPEPPAKHEKEKLLTLDRFLVKNTSEDNASFAEIMRENELKHQQKHAWLYESEKIQQNRHEEMLALPSIETQALTTNNADTETWKYVAKNSLMYVPEGCLLSPEEKIKNQKAKTREIVHKSTRFRDNPFNEQKNQETIAEAVSVQALMNHGKIGVDGKEILPMESPNVNGYGFMGTPSPAPGVDESPLMTWGEIEGTPFRLDAGDTPITLITNSGGPMFKIPQVPKRDQIGLDLAEKASKAHRTKKEDALRRVTARLTSPNLKFGSAAGTDRLHSLSPAAQQLANTKLGIRTSSHKALRASYTPSPSPESTTPCRTTPTRTPSARSTPGSSRASQHAAATAERTPTRRRQSTQQPSLTDDLLNLPKRPKARDFF